MCMKYKYILFDLDGTLTDPKVGITKSVSYALDKMGLPDVDPNSLTKFIGPPLQESFVKFYGFGEEEAKNCISYYREYFRGTGIYENEIYEGIESLLKSLKEKGYILAVATSKSTVFAEKVLEHFKIRQYFTRVVGSELDGTRSKKAEIIQSVLDELEVLDKKQVIMIGDREHDIIGANTIGIDSLGVKYGYAEGDELRKAGATYVVGGVEELKSYL